MPNWCSNDVEIHGSKEDIAALHELIGDNFDFNKIVPMPPELESETLGDTGCKRMVFCDKNMLCHHCQMHRSCEQVCR